VQGSKQRTVLSLAGSMNWWWYDYHTRISEPQGCTKVIKPLVMYATASLQVLTFRFTHMWYWLY